MAEDPEVRKTLQADAEANNWFASYTTPQRPYSVYLHKGSRRMRVSCPLSSKEVAQLWIDDWKAVDERSKGDDLRINLNDKEI